MSIRKIVFFYFEIFKFLEETKPNLQYEPIKVVLSYQNLAIKIENLINVAHFRYFMNFIGPLGI